MYALSEEQVNMGAARETFFYNQLSAVSSVQYSAKGDFVANKNVFEIGGKDKGYAQIKDVQNAFIVKDEIEYPAGNALPLWIFGFLY
jgi:hypothetical protein